MYCLFVLYRCAAITALLTMHASWETQELPLEEFQAGAKAGQYALSEEQKQYIRRYVPREKAILLLSLWEICMDEKGSHSVWEFMDKIVTTASSAFNLGSSCSKASSIWVLDKKRERLLTTSMKQV